jgi:hypothetical protein
MRKKETGKGKDKRLKKTRLGVGRFPSREFGLGKCGTGGKEGGGAKSQTSSSFGALDPAGWKSADWQTALESEFGLWRT